MAWSIQNNGDLNGLTNEEKGFDYLPERWLTLMFTFIPVMERIKLERVCRKWQRTSRASWAVAEKLVITSPSDPEIDIIIGTNEYVDLQTTSSNKIISVLRRCGEYIHDFSIQEFASAFDHNVLSNVSQYCHNIVNIEVQELRQPSQKGLGELFERNRNIRGLTWVVCPPGTDECLQYLPIQRLEELRLLFSHEFTSIYYLNELLKKAQSLKYLKLRDYVIDAYTIELIGNLQNLEELYLLELVVDQPAVQEAFMRIAEMKTLRKAALKGKGTTDEFLMRLALNSSNIIDLDVASNPNVTERGLEAIGMLKHLRYLDVANISRFNDDILNMFDSLVKLRCSGCTGITDRGLITLVRKSRNLRCLHICDCSLRYYPETFNAMAGAVEARGDRSVLEIVVQNTLDITNFADFRPYLNIRKLGETH